MKEPLKKGSFGEEVKQWQLFLQSAGYKIPYVDGAFGPATERETLKFQTKNGLKPDGVVGPKTWQFVTTISNNMVSVQQNYIGYIGRINTITYNVPLQTYLETGTDGYQISDGKVVTYIITGTTEVDSSSTNAANTFVELNNDVKKIKESIDEFNKISNNPIEFSFNNEEYSGILVFKSDYKLNIDDVFIPFSKGNFDDKIFRRVYMILSNDVVDSNSNSFPHGLAPITLM
jgi:peptidoglycan hydrolase-like protein with peptidoglycan-binding domain